MGEEQVFDRVAFDAERLERAKNQRDGGVRTGVDDGGAWAGDYHVGGIHLRPDILGVDGGDAVGEPRQAWQTLVHDPPFKGNISA